MATAADGGLLEPQPTAMLLEPVPPATRHACRFTCKAVRDLCWVMTSANLLDEPQMPRPSSRVPLSKMRWHSQG